MEIVLTDKRFTLRELGLIKKFIDIKLTTIERVKVIKYGLEKLKGGTK